MHESVSVDPAKKMAISLVDCLRKYGAKEQLSQNDTWYCSKCKDHRRAFKKLDLWSTPDVLIVHLKRFQYAQGTYFVHTTKLDDLVDFPLEGLDLTEFVAGHAGPDPLIYDLFAVSVSGCCGAALRAWLSLLLPACSHPACLLLLLLALNTLPLVTLWTLGP